MNNKLFLLTVLATFVLLNGGDSVAADDRPNILFCPADDWGWPHAGAYGDPVVQTPTFDRLASEGVLFHQAYVSSPSCTPSRNSVITGQQFYRLGPGANLYGALDIKHPNFMFRLRDAGYEIGHWRKAWGPGQFQQGGYTEHPCGPGMSFTQFMESRDANKPFCFWFGTSDPHRRYYDLSFAKRPSEELYVVAADGDQVRNVADDLKLAEIKQQLAAQLTDYLQRTGDPRETAAEAEFDEYPYIGGVPKWPGEETIEQYER
ncbi:MAG: sulfatase-like hydrolase/transferase [Candidatus Paceibacterota bacterium]